MKIAILCRTEHNIQLGGVESVSLALSEAFKVKGHEVVLISGSRRDEAYVIHSLSPAQVYLEDSVNNRSWPVNDIAKVFKEIGADVLIHESLYDEAFAFNVLKACEKCGLKTFSVIHNHPLYMLRTVSRARFLEYGLDFITRVKLFIKYLLKGYYYNKEYNRCKELISRLYEKSDRLVFLSDKYINLAENTYQINIFNKSVSIPNPVYYESEFEYQEAKKENIVLFVGRFENFSKRVDRLLKMWKIVESRLSDWKLRLVGDGPDKERMERFSQSLGLRNVEFTGSKNPTEEYRRAKIICLTSDFEGFSMVLMEAQHFGCVPIVLNRFETAEEVIINGYNGFLPDTEREYIERLVYLTSHEDKRIKMAENIPRIINEYSIDKISDIWIKEMESILV